MTTFTLIMALVTIAAAFLGFTSIAGSTVVAITAQLVFVVALSAAAIAGFTAAVRDHHAH